MYVSNYRDKLHRGNINRLKKFAIKVSYGEQKRTKKKKEKKGRNSTKEEKLKEKALLDTI